MKPVFGAHDVNHLNYNLPDYDPVWALLQEADLPLTLHVGTGRDPRAAKGHGGAIINYVAHALSPAIEPVAALCASGVPERFPRLRLAVIAAGICWVPWGLYALAAASIKGTEKRVEG